MTRILLINPNSNAATTAMMVEIAAAAAGNRARITGATARHGPAMLTTPADLAAAAVEVIAIGRSQAAPYSAILVAAFGDPGAAELAQIVAIPVLGLAEASMRAAAAGQRRFGVATVTPALVPAIAARAAQLGLGPLYCGTRVTPNIPTDPHALTAALASAVAQCQADGAQAVIIGGGPLAQAASALQHQCAIPIIAPLPSAIHQLITARA